MKQPEDIIDLNIVTKESLKMKDLTPREKSIWDAGVDHGSNFGKWAAIIICIMMFAMFTAIILSHNSIRHGSMWADY